MRDHVTVVSEDQVIIVDGEALRFEFRGAESMHALQWHNGGGHIELYNNMMPIRLTPDNYADEVAPFVALWEGEKARIEAERNKPPTLEQSRLMAFERIKQVRDARLEQGGIVWNGYLVSIDKEATDRMTSKAVEFIAGAVTETRWKMSDGAYAVLDKSAFFAMSTAAGAVVQACYGVEEAKRVEVENLPDAAAVLAWLAESANLLTGWPDDLGE